MKKMASSSIKHNKKRSSGIVYEMLVRKMGIQMIDGDRDGFSKTFALVEEYFGPSKPIGHEMELFNIVRSTRGVSEQTARKILGEVSRAAAQMDYKALDIKKSNLIKEVNHSFGQDFFSKFKLADYRLLASIQVFLDGCRPGRALSENVQKIHVEDALVRYMTASSESAATSVNQQEVDVLVARLAHKKFQEKYGSTLNEGQKRILNEYSRYLFTSNPGPLRNILKSEKKRFLDIMESARSMPEVVSDDIMRKRLDEAYSGLEKTDIGRIHEDTVQEMMLYHRLCEELESKE